MLVLTRALGQEIVIDRNIRVVIVDIGGDRVRIGIEAPPSIRVDRLEIHRKIMGEECDASMTVMAAGGRGA